MVFEHAHYRDFLKSALASPAGGASLRAFAAKLRVSTSFLSEVLSAKKSLSVELAFKIAVKLRLTEAETQYFCLLVQLEQEKDPEFREELASRLATLNPQRQGHELSADLFKSIAEWHHAAILELSHLPQFPLQPEAIAKKLGITKVEAELALDRLKRLELLEKDARGRLRKSHPYVYAESKIPNAAFRAFHQGLLEKALLSLSAQTPQERVSGSDVLAIDSKHLPEVERLSREFSAAVLKLGDKSKTRDHVYALGVHFFKLTQT